MQQPNGLDSGTGRRPNILYLMTDHQNASATSALGNRNVPSPFMDSMAASGVVFSDVYSTSPICTPSRASVFTGVHPLVHQVFCHQNRAPENLPQLSELLADAGYYTAVVGHYEHERELTRGWRQQVGHSEGDLGRAAAAWYSHGRKDVGWSSGSLEYGGEKGHAHAVTTRAIQVLDEIAASGAPFFLHVPYLEPHPPYFVSPPYDSMVDPESVRLPDRGTDAGRPAWQMTAREQFGSALAAEADVRKMISIFYGMIAYADSQMGRLYHALAQRGLMENTWVILGSDHGDYQGEKGMYMKSESLYECLLHVPLTIAGPEGVEWPRGRVISGLVENVDLFPTILGLAGVPVPEHTQGQDLVSWVGEGAHEPLHDVVFHQIGDYHGHFGTTLPSGTVTAGRHASLLQGARSAEYSYIRDSDYGDEAYDLRSDPKELVNLLGTGRQAPPGVDELRRRVDDWEEECLRLRERLGVRPGYRGFG